MKKRGWKGPVVQKQAGKKKTGKKKKIICVSMAAVIVVSGGVWYWQKQRTQVPAMERKVTEVQAEQGDLANTIVGTGNLTMAATDSLTIPSGLTMDAVNVESGDTVKKGDVLATVNSLSVLQRVVEVQKQIDQIEEELEDAEDDEDISEEETELWNAQKEALEETLDELQALKKNPSIKAKKAGIVGEVYVSEETAGDSSSDDTTSGTKSTLTSSNNQKSTATNLSASGETSGIAATNLSNTVVKSSISALNLSAVTAANVQNQTPDHQIEKTQTEKNVQTPDQGQQPDYSDSNPNQGDQTQENPNQQNAATGQTGGMPNTSMQTGNSGMQVRGTAGGGEMQSSGAAQVAAATSQAAQTTGTNSTTNSFSTDVTAFTFASEDTMSVTVNVDELDINSVSEGQEAEITLDALSDETFTGTVQKVSSSASTSNSGVAKYSVEISIPKSSEMKAGMSASATITVEKKEGVVTIPAAALQERGGRSFVYTQKAEDGTLSGEQEVTTGLSNETTVEITEGLDVGTTIYYQRLGSEKDSSTKGMSGGFGGGQNGDMPGGNMPGGDMPGGGGNMPGGGFGGKSGGDR
ncbi:MAG: efflux RND transporter periplasmic adaptor subunit [Lachnospiraceae bacterium]